MEKNKTGITIAVIALLVSIIGVGIAFAAMSQDLTINGGGTLDPANWKVRFDTMSLTKAEGGDATATTPTVTATSIGTYSVTLTKPGDYVRYTFDVENDGSLDAKIGNLVMPDPVCTGTGDTAAADEALVCNNLVYTLTYDTYDGTPVAIGNTLAKNSGTATTATMVLTVEYPNTMSSLPNDDVTITFPTLTITYEQD